MLVGGASHRQPFLINRARFLSVHVNVAVSVSGFSFADAHGLVPAVHSRNRIGMDREGQVLMHTDVAPPDTQSVRVLRFVWPGPAFALQSPPVALVIESDRCH